MGLKAFVLPVCDVCTEAWLPDKESTYKGVSAREDPRRYDSLRRADKLPPLRCGKCKSFGWDRNYTGDRRRKTPHALPGASEKTAPTKIDSKRPRAASKKVHSSHKAGKTIEMPVAAFHIKKRCLHGLLNCQQCHRAKLQGGRR